MLITRKKYENTEDRVDLGTIEVRTDQELKSCELTKVELTKDRVDHKSDQITFFWQLQL